MEKGLTEEKISELDSEGRGFSPRERLALAYAEKLAAEMSPEQTIVVNLSGRGDKDIHTVAQIEGIEF